MPKKESQNDRAKQFFTLENTEKKTYLCNIDGCAKKIIGNNSSALVSHIKCMHLSIYKSTIVQEADADTIKLKRLQMIQHCAEIVSVNGRPLNYLRDSGFQSIIRDQMNLLNVNDSGVDFHYLTEIKQYVLDSAAKMREMMKKEIDGRFVSVMIDIGSKNTVSILSICLQFIIDGQIRVRNIGMMQLNKRHRSSYIKEVVAERLAAFGINRLQVISFTTDNASNMRATIKLFDDDIGDMDDDESGDAEQDELIAREGMQNLRINTGIRNELSNIQLQEILRQYSNEDDEDSTLLSILDDQSVFAEAAASVELDFRNYTFNVHGIPCSAHTLQLAVNQALKNLPAESLISLCRVAAKLLRRETYIYDLKEAGINTKTVRIDCAVRWNSIYLMVGALYNICMILETNLSLLSLLLIVFFNRCMILLFVSTPSNFLVKQD